MLFPRQLAPLALLTLADAVAVRQSGANCTRPSGHGTGQGTTSGTTLASTSGTDTFEAAADGNLASSYDYVIVGGGTAGLTVANRLSEDSGVTVLVIEAGDFDNKEDFITVPGLAGGAIGTKYDWNTTYEANPALQGREVSIPTGKLVGGSTKLNRLVFDRGSKSDYDRWAELGSTGWDFAGLLPYFKKSENFTGPTEEILDEYNITTVDSAHGTDGNVDVTYSRYFYSLTKNHVAANAELGITLVEDQADGNAVGGYYNPHNIDPDTVTRCSAEEAQYDTAKNRSNFQLITGQQVTRLIMDASNGTARVTGVEYAASAGAATSTITVNKEAIMAAGSLRTPQILQVSGIGASSLLESIGVSTVVDLPAVGQNLQDHVLLSVVNSISTGEVSAANLSDTAFAAAALTEYKQNKSGPYTSPTGDFLSFLPLSTYTNNSASITSAASTQNGSQYLPTDVPAEVVAGYVKQEEILNDRLSRDDSGLLEVILDTSGTVILGLEHPYSRGSVRASSNSTFDAPLASPAFLANPIDAQLLVEGIKFVRTLTKTAAFQELQAVEILPGSNVTSDAAIETYVRENSATLYHPAGSCKMGARADGGVVDDSLKVYGTSNLRVVDASVIPLLPAAHTMATVYAVAEKAADIIKGVTSV